MVFVPASLGDGVGEGTDELVPIKRPGLVGEGLGNGCPGVVTSEAVVLVVLVVAAAGSCRLSLRPTKCTGAVATR